MFWEKTKQPKSSYLSIIFYHDVTVVAITNAQYKGSNTVASTRTCKQVDSCIIPIENKKRWHFPTDILTIKMCKSGSLPASFWPRINCFVKRRQKNPRTSSLLWWSDKFSILWQQKQLQVDDSKLAIKVIVLLWKVSSSHLMSYC